MRRNDLARLLVAGAVVPLWACRGEALRPGPDADLDAAPPWDAADLPEPRQGMLWIPPGVLLAGTPPDRLPRVADAEMAGEQVMMHGYYIDVFPYPNEIGAIPTTNVSHPEAAASCDEQGKRLCTELEWERACKGVANTTYEYGDAYKAAICGTGSGRALVPNGVNASCQSPFGVHDLHGGVWSWTASQWNRDPAKTGLVTMRGGNGASGDLVGRCANGRPAKPEARRDDVGYRCCAGEVNTFEVVLSVKRGEPLVWQPPDDKLAPALELLVPEEMKAAVRGRRAEDQFKVERMWIWHPLGNEELVIAGGCARPGDHSRCGVLVARARPEAPAMLMFVPSDRWEPTVGTADSPRELFVLGGDSQGAFRKRMTYEWGRISVGDKERKKKRKGRTEPSFE